MKRLIYCIIALLGFTACGTAIKVTSENATVNNFTFNDGTVTWSKVYPINPADSAAVRDWFASNFTITRNGEKTIFGEMPKNALPVKESGQDRMQVMMLLSHACVVYFTADFKDNRYRVVVNRIIWYPQMALTVYGVSQGVGAMDLNEVALKNGGYSSAFYRTTSKQVDLCLDYLFTAKLNSVAQNDVW